MRRIDLWATLGETHGGIALTLTDEDGHSATTRSALPSTLAKGAAGATEALREGVSRMGPTIFEILDVQVNFSKARLVPASALNALRREAVQALEADRALAFIRLKRAEPVTPPVPHPDDTLSFLANVFNSQAHAFYARHGVKVIAPAYESVQELGEVNLMITKHYAHFS